MIKNLPNEVWKPITDYPNYQISNMGRVKSLNYKRSKQEHLLKICRDKYGYSQVALYNDKTPKTLKVHRLVAYAFIPNDDLTKTQINHKSEDKTDNRVENLEWCDIAYNNKYGTHNERIAKSHINNKKQSKQVVQYSLDGNFIWSFVSVREIERQLGYNNGYISKCCLGKIKTAYGFIWKYA